MALVTAALCAAVTLSACSRAPGVSLAPQAAAPVCATVRWPASVSGHDPVTTSPASPSVSAWGDPAIIARCGLDPLGPTTDECVTVNGVDWVVRSLSDGTAATTFGRDPAIEVLVPADYGPVPLLLPVFDEVAKTLPSNGRRCT
ncbi:MAG: DUF3515 family protein [Terracoccus sp.]